MAIFEYFCNIVITNKQTFLKDKYFYGARQVQINNAC